MYYDIDNGQTPLYSLRDFIVHECTRNYETPALARRTRLAREKQTMAPKQPNARSLTFNEHLKQVLERFDKPEFVGNESPLAAP